MNSGRFGKIHNNVEYKVKNKNTMNGWMNHHGDGY